MPVSRPGEANVENQKFEGNNLTPTLISQGYLTPQLIVHAKDSSANLGGPILKDSGGSSAAAT